MLRSCLCDYSDAYIVAKGKIDILATATNENDKAEKDVAFRNNGPFRSCINSAEDLDIVMPMYNLLQYVQNYSMTSASL